MDLAAGENRGIFDPAPPPSAEYGDAGFWDGRYQSDPEAFEWYLDYSVYRHIITAEVPLEASVCISGCGNSDMPIDMLEDGYQDITAVDVSRVVIDQMRRKYGDDGIKWVQANMVHCEFPDEQFDAVIDKACLDAIWCHPAGDAHLHYYLKQVERILKPAGVYICISSAPPDQQLRVLWNQDVRSPSFLSWEVDVQAIAKPQLERHVIPDLQDWKQMYFIYVCRRMPELIERRQRWEEAQRSRAKRTARKLLNPPTT